MGTLYIRDVPAAVTAVLKQRAASEGLSLSAYVGTELGKLAARPTNGEIADRLKAGDREFERPTVDEIVKTVRDGRR